MIDEIRKDVAALWDSRRGTGQVLEGIETVWPHDSNMMSDYMPGVTFEYNNESHLEFTGNHWEFRLRFKGTLYTASLNEKSIAVEEHLNLLCRFESGRLRGLIPAAAELAERGYSSDSGLSFKVAVEKATRSFGIKGKRHQHWTLATEIFLNFTTWLTSDQVTALT